MRDSVRVCQSRSSWSASSWARSYTWAGRWIGLDLLATPGLFARVWPRICAGYAAEAGGEEERQPITLTPEAVPQGLLGVPAGPAPAVGLGCEHRLRGGSTGPCSWWASASPI